MNWDDVLIRLPRSTREREARGGIEILRRGGGSGGAEGWVQIVGRQRRDGGANCSFIFKETVYGAFQCGGMNEGRMNGSARPCQADGTD